MSAISTCHSPPSLATGHKRQIPFYLHQLGPWAIFTSHCQGITKAERETLTPLRDWEVEIQTDRGRGKAGGDLEDRGAGGEKPSLRASGVSRSMSTHSEMKSKETQRAGTTGCTLGLFGPTFSVHPEN